jgi:hypothetical protein
MAQRASGKGLGLPKAHTQMFQTCKWEAPPHIDSDDTRLPTGQITPEAPHRGPSHKIADTMATFGDESADLSVAAKAACMLSAARVKATPPKKSPAFKRPSWADLSEEPGIEPAEPPVVSWSSTPDLHSWASTPDLSPRPRGPGVAPADRQKHEKMALAPASMRAKNAPRDTGASSDTGSSDASVLALIRGLREAAALD